MALLKVLFGNKPHENIGQNALFVNAKYKKLATNVAKGGTPRRV